MSSSQARSDAVTSARKHTAAFQIIVLGSGGGPNEDNVTGLLVRSVAKGWSKGSVLAVDAGVHLASIIRILDTPKPSISTAETGSHSTKITARRIADDSTSLSKYVDKEYHVTRDPFGELDLPFSSAKANAAYITRDLISTYLITHPHLDHISGFVINTASFQHTYRPKRLAALPGTIEAIKSHIFNDVIWPNMSDEDDGIGLVSYMRLAHGGNMSLGDGKARGYIEICDGLSVRSWSISHGHTMKRIGRRDSNAGLSHEILGSPANTMPPMFNNSSSSAESRGRSHSFSWERPCPNDSTAFFIRDEVSGQETLIFGDVEPDSISLQPRTAQVWAEAAPKIALGLLSSIFIEVSFDDSQNDDMLFGHLAPRHLAAELLVLAQHVHTARAQPRELLPTPPIDSSVPISPPSASAATSMVVAEAKKKSTTSVGTAATRKRKRLSNGVASAAMAETKVKRRDESPRDSRHLDSSLGQKGADSVVGEMQGGLDVGVGVRVGDTLRGLKVFVIHVKDPLSDGLDRGSKILSELENHKAEMGLGCDFIITESGTAIYV